MNKCLKGSNEIQYTPQVTIRHLYKSYHVFCFLWMWQKSWMKKMCCQFWGGLPQLLNCFHATLWGLSMLRRRSEPSGGRPRWTPHPPLSGSDHITKNVFLKFHTTTQSVMFAKLSYSVFIVLSTLLSGTIRRHVPISSHASRHWKSHNAIKRHTYKGICNRC